MTTLLAALPGLPLATLAVWLAAPEAGVWRAGSTALAALPLLVLSAAWALRRVPAAAPRIAASCGAAPLAVVLRVWVPLTLPRLAAGVAGTVLLVGAIARAAIG